MIKDPATKTGAFENLSSPEKVLSAYFVRECFGDELWAHMPQRKETFVTLMQSFELRIGPYTMFVRINEPLFQHHANETPATFQGDRMSKVRFAVTIVPYEYIALSLCDAHHHAASEWFIRVSRFVHSMFSISPKPPTPLET